MVLGESLGALVTFELTRWLRRTRRRMPELLVISALAPVSVFGGQEDTTFPARH